MANTQADFGFQQLGYQPGGAPDFQYSTRGISKSNLTAIYFGDVVQRVNATSAYITQGTAATTYPIEGIFYGCYYQISGNTVQWSPYWPGITVAADATAYIIDAPNAQFRVAALNTAIVSSNIGALINYNVAQGTTIGLGVSGMTVDQSTIATTSGTTASGLPFRIVALYGGTGNFGGVGNGSDSTTPYNWVIVGFNNQISRTLGGI